MRTNLLLFAAVAAWAQPFRPEIPRTWDDEALRTMELPLATLSMEIWRACRLVVDTGMHALGWPRQRAIDFMKENTGLTEHNVVTEIDRYIDEPGQALAYKIGELKIKELRRLAEGELGPRFSVRAFHDAVLANGSIPLVVLEVEIRRWIDETKASK